MKKREREREGRDIFGLHKHRAIRDENKKNKIYRTNKTINRRASKEKNFVYKWMVVVMTKTKDE